MNEWRYVTVTAGGMGLGVYFAQTVFVEDSTLKLKCVAELDGFWDARPSAVVGTFAEINMVLGPAAIVRTCLRSSGIGLSAYEEMKLGRLFRINHGYHG